MNEEIKEILEDLKEHTNNKYVSPFELIDEECKLLLDYITNLQDENKKLNNQLDFIGEQNKYIDKLLEIINYYGVNKQLKYIHSEYFELDEAIIQFDWNDEIYNEKYAINCIAGELADVIVMLKQFQYYYNISDEQIEEIMKFKIDRQLERIKNET